jgi:hypothetical protein
VLVHAGEAFAGLEVLLDGPPEPGDFHHGGKGDLLRGVAAVERQFPGAWVVADQLPAASWRVVCDSDPGPVEVALAFGPGPGGQSLPGPRAEASSELIGAKDAPGSADTRVITRHGQHIADLGFFQPSPHFPLSP